MLNGKHLFHTGQELGRAINRMDFFRLYKAMSMSHGFSEFGLIELPPEIADFRYSRAMALHSWPNLHMSEIDRRSKPQQDQPVAHLIKYVVPAVFLADGTPSGEPVSPLMIHEEPSCVVAVPLHTPTGKRFGLLMIGAQDKAEYSDIGGISYEAALIFQRYYEAILSLDSLTGLTEREIQIVRWTAEGKTSAEIAVILKLSEHTVNSYTATVLRKLQVVNRAQMVATAIRNGLIT